VDSGWVDESADLGVMLGKLFGINKSKSDDEGTKQKDKRRTK
jgi:hypothetical protein